MHSPLAAALHLASPYDHDVTFTCDDLESITHTVAEGRAGSDRERSPGWSPIEATDDPWADRLRGSGRTVG
jgi:hypothetical protein